MLTVTTMDHRNRLEDGELVSRCLGGDKRAFEVLVTRHQGKLFALAHARTGDRNLAEDIVQSAFVKAYTSLERLQKPERFVPWIMRIVLNLSLKSLSRRALARRHLAQTVRDSLPPEPSAADQVSLRETREAARELLNLLPADLRAMVTLRYMEGLTLKGIGEALDIPLSTVQKKLVKARGIMRASVRQRRGEP